MWVFLSARLRRWVLVALVLPLAGRVLEALGARVAPSRPRAGQALSRTGGHLRYGRRGWRRR